MPTHYGGSQASNHRFNTSSTVTQTSPQVKPSPIMPLSERTNFNTAHVPTQPNRSSDHGGISVSNAFDISYSDVSKEPMITDPEIEKEKDEHYEGAGADRLYTGQKKHHQRTKLLAKGYGTTAECIATNPLPPPSEAEEPSPSTPTPTTAVASEKRNSTIRYIKEEKELEAFDSGDNLFPKPVYDPATPEQYTARVKSQTQTTGSLSDTRPYHPGAANKPGKPKTVFIGISGAFSSGKTTLLTMLQILLEPRYTVMVLQQDDFFKTEDVVFPHAPEEENQKISLVPSGVEMTAFKRHLEFIRDTGTMSSFHRTRHDIDAEKDLATHQVSEYLLHALHVQARKIGRLCSSAQNICLVEGDWLYHDKDVLSLIDIKLFLRARKKTVKDRILSSKWVKHLGKENETLVEDIDFALNNVAWPGYVDKLGFLFGLPPPPEIASLGASSPSLQPTPQLESLQTMVDNASPSSRRTIPQIKHMLFPVRADNSPRLAETMNMTYSNCESDPDHYLCRKLGIAMTPWIDGNLYENTIWALGALANPRKMRNGGRDLTLGDRIRDGFADFWSKIRTPLVGWCVDFKDRTSTGYEPEGKHVKVREMDLEE